jgi:hypothetical protein
MKFILIILWELIMLTVFGCLFMLQGISTPF